MKSILIANPKGGSGKSTLSTNLAGYLAQAGHRVMLGDTDRQHSAREWLKIRSAALPSISGWTIEKDQPLRPHARDHRANAGPSCWRTGTPMGRPWRASAS